MALLLALLLVTLRGFATPTHDAVLALPATAPTAERAPPAAPLPVPAPTAADFYPACENAVDTSD